MNISPSTCLSVLSARGLLPADRQAVYLAGSLVRGWGNATSDLDVYVVTSDPWRGRPEGFSPVSVTGVVPVQAFYEGERRWDVEYWLDSQVEELLGLVSWEAYESSRSSASTLTWAEIAFIDRLESGKAVAGGAWLEKRQQQFSDSAITKMVAAHALQMLDQLTEDAVGMKENDDLDSAVLAARLALGFAVDALLASRGDITEQPKWRARRLRAAAPPEIPFDKYWAIETMRTYDRQAPETWVDEALWMCQQIAQEVQL